MEFTREYLAERHRLSHQQIDRFLNENKAGNYLPEKMRQLERLRHFLAISTSLRNAGLKFICVKGPLLSWRLYQDASVRKSRDFDFLFAQADVDLAIRTLLNLGYEPGDSVLWPAEKHRQTLLMGNQHHIMLFHKQLQVCVEIHWTLTHETPLSIKQIQSLVEQHHEETTFMGQRFHVLEPELELIYLMIHGSKHGWMRLKWLDDIAHYPVDLLNKEKFMQLAGYFGAERIIQQTDMLLRKFYNRSFFVQVTNKRFPAILTTFPEYMMNEPVVENPSLKQTFRLVFYWQNMFTNTSFKLKQMRVYFLRTGDVSNINFRYSFLYYLYRPFGLIKRRFLHVR